MRIRGEKVWKKSKTGPGYMCRVRVASTTISLSLSAEVMPWSNFTFQVCDSVLQVTMTSGPCRLPDAIAF